MSPRSALAALALVLLLVAMPAALPQTPPTPPSGGGPGCGGPDQPPCQTGGCSTCPPPCPGSGSAQADQGGADIPSLEFLASTSSSRSGGQVVVVAGLANDVTLKATNPLGSAFAGTIDLYPQGAVVNATHFDITLAPHGTRLLALRITPGAEQNGFGLSFRANGTAGAAAVCGQSNVNAQVAPPVSIDWVTPHPSTTMATVESLSLRNGFGGGDIALGAAHTVQVRATNLANTTSKSFYLLATVNQQAIASAATPVPALAPGASALLDLGAIPPPPADCNGPVPKQGCGAGTFLMVATAAKADATNGAPAASFTAHDGRVASTSYLALSVQDPGDIMPVMEGAPTAALGKLYSATLNVTNYGNGASSNSPIRVAFVPPFRAQYDVQGEESTSFLVSTAPGASSARGVSFTPLISGRWEMLVYFVPTGEICCAVNAFTVDVPGRVNVSVPSTSVAVVPLGQSARTAMLVRSDVALPGATLRITIAPEASGGREGPRGGSAQSVLGGLSGTLVRAEPTSVPLGDLAPGVDVWSNVTVTARASGVYNVVPYVVADGVAYTGAPLTDAELQSPTPPAFTPQFTVAFDAKPIPLALAWAPAAFVLVAGVGLFVGRRMWIK